MKKKNSFIVLLLILIINFFILTDVNAVDSVIDTVGLTGYAIEGVAPYPIDGVVFGNKMFISNNSDNNRKVVDVLDLSVNKVTNHITLQHEANSMLIVGSKLYIAGQESPSISIIDASTNTILKTVTSDYNIGSKMITANNKIYILSNDDKVLIFDIETELFTGFFNTGSGPGDIKILNNKIYVTNINSDTVSVINTLNNATSTISVGSTPGQMFEVNNKLYVLNLNSSNVTVINPVLDTASTTISLSAGGISTATVVGSELYVNNSGTTTVSVIDTLNDTVTDILSVGLSPSSSKLYGNKLYIVNASLINNRSRVSIINTTNKTVNNNLFYFGRGAKNIIQYNNKLYFLNTNSGDIHVLDTSTELFINYIPQDFPDTYVGPLESTVVGSKLYINNSYSDRVSVLETSTNTIIDSFVVGLYPIKSILVDTKLYVLSSQMLSVINVINNTVTKNIFVGDSPSNMYFVGNKIFGLNKNSYDISVIDTTTDTLINTINYATVGNNTYATDSYNASVVGNKLYVSDSVLNRVSIVDTNNDTYIESINVGIGPRKSKLHNNKLYVNNYGTSTISVINTLNNTVTTIPVGSGPSDSIVINNKMYVTNFFSDKISVIDTNTDQVTETITVGQGADHLSVFNGKLYVSISGSNIVSVIDTALNTVIQTLNVGTAPVDKKIVGGNIYVNNIGSDSVSVVQLDAPGVIPSVNGASLTVVYPEVFAPGVVPNMANFRVNNNFNITSLAIGNDSKSLDFQISPSVKSTDNVSLTYTPPVINPLIDIYGNTSGTLNSVLVTNNTPSSISNVSSGIPVGSSFSYSYKYPSKNIVVPASTSTKIIDSCYVFKTNLKLNIKNKEVLMVKKFLNKLMDEKLNENLNVYDRATFNAVKRFQIKYKDKILTPLNLKYATGLWYQSSRAQANQMCLPLMI